MPHSDEDQALNTAVINWVVVRAELRAHHLGRGSGRVARSPRSDVCSWKRLVSTMLLIPVATGCKRECDVREQSCTHVSLGLVIWRTCLSCEWCRRPWKKA